MSLSFATSSCAPTRPTLLLTLHRRGRWLPRGWRHLRHGRDAYLPSGPAVRGLTDVEAVTQVLGWDDRRLHLFHTIVAAVEDPAGGDRASTCSCTWISAAGRASPVREGVRDRVGGASARAHCRACRDPARAGRPDPDSKRTLTAAEQRARSIAAAIAL